MPILTNLILSAAATICLTVIAGMLAIMLRELPVKKEGRE
jgi:hypothetical protein